jgi:hypothetical protein
VGKQSGRGGRLRVFFADFEGDDDTIQEGLRAIGIAVNKTFQSPVVYRTLPPPSTATVQEPLLEEPVIDDDAFDPPQNVGRQPSRGKRKLPALAIVKSLNLRPDGKQSLREFFSGKSPKTQLEQVAVAVYYLERVLELTGITAEHVYTCFNDVNAGQPPVPIKVPNDLPQIIRNCAARKGWVDVTDSNNIKVTQRGVNTVEGDLPAKGV